MFNIKLFFIQLKAKTEQAIDNMTMKHNSRLAPFGVSKDYGLPPVMKLLLLASVSDTRLFTVGILDLAFHKDVIKLIEKSTPGSTFHHVSLHVRSINL